MLRAGGRALQRPGGEGPGAQPTDPPLCGARRKGEGDVIRGMIRVCGRNTKSYPAHISRTRTFHCPNYSMSTGQSLSRLPHRAPPRRWDPDAPRPRPARCRSGLSRPLAPPQTCAARFLPNLLVPSLLGNPPCWPLVFPFLAIPPELRPSPRGPRASLPTSLYVTQRAPTPPHTPLTTHHATHTHPHTRTNTPHHTDACTHHPFTHTHRGSVGPWSADPRAEGVCRAGDAVPRPPLLSPALRNSHHCPVSPNTVEHPRPCV